MERTTLLDAEGHAPVAGSTMLLDAEGHASVAESTMLLDAGGHASTSLSTARTALCTPRAEGPKQEMAWHPEIEAANLTTEEEERPAGAGRCDPALWAGRCGPALRASPILGYLLVLVGVVLLFVGLACKTANAVSGGEQQQTAAPSFVQALTKEKGFDCLGTVVSWQQWSAEQKSYCCARQGTGCEGGALPVQSKVAATVFDCSVGADDPEVMWPNDKQAYCCKTIRVCVTHNDHNHHTDTAPFFLVGVGMVGAVGAAMFLFFRRAQDQKNFQALPAPFVRSEPRSVDSHVLQVKQKVEKRKERCCDWEDRRSCDWGGGNRGGGNRRGFFDGWSSKK